MHLHKEALKMAKAIGGCVLIVSTKGKVEYESEQAKLLPLVKGGELVQPDLLSFVAEATEEKVTVTRRFTGGFGPMLHVAVEASHYKGWIVLSISNLTETVQTEQVRRDFVSSVGHELRTPITAIELIAQTLGVVADDPEQVSHFAGRLEEEITRLSALTENMLSLSLAQEKASDMEFTEVDLDKVIAKAVRHQEMAARKKKVEFVVVGKKAKASVWGDQASLVSALENLLSNAVHYSQEGAQVRITSAKDYSSREVAVSVADQGIGISPEDQERIFERFYRADPARAQRTGGSGLGLSIVKNIMARHGGSVRVVSVPNAGSTFTLRLPLYEGG
ncbi:MAG: HAMP domain-containing histidine kinase [Propionibacteriaceae bacterium]|jgi:two-component system sensor histidine kinase SenX3|nr:HAMP domain-containing histidine kinase [Propionibacteriaceae bacterium]